MRPLFATKPGWPSDMAASTCWKASAAARVPDAVRIASSSPLTDGRVPVELTLPLRRRAGQGRGELFEVGREHGVGHLQQGLQLGDQLERVDGQHDVAAHPRDGRAADRRRVDHPVLQGVPAGGEPVGDAVQGEAVAVRGGRPGRPDPAPAGTAARARARRAPWRRGAGGRAPCARRSGGASAGADTPSPEGGRREVGAGGDAQGGALGVRAAAEVHLAQHAEPCSGVLGGDLPVADVGLDDDAGRRPGPALAIWRRRWPSRRTGRTA